MASVFPAFRTIIYMILNLTALSGSHLRRLERLDAVLNVRAIFLKPYIFDTISERHKDSVIKGENGQRKISFLKIDWRKTYYYRSIGFCESWTVCCVSLAILGMFYCCECYEIIAIFIDIIWAASVKPGPFPVQNQRTDFGRSLSGTCVHRLSCRSFSYRKVVLFQILFYVISDANIIMLLFIRARRSRIKFTLYCFRSYSKSWNCLAGFLSQASW